MRTQRLLDYRGQFSEKFLWLVIKFVDEKSKRNSMEIRQRLDNCLVSVEVTNSSGTSRLGYSRSLQEFISCKLCESINPCSYVYKSISKTTADS